ncbi:MAG: hypothetical protein JW990_16320, partial [Thermoleophilia bacterium]|nr:hypothetical protein [Thermoleophilia bacterium]
MLLYFRTPSMTPTRVEAVTTTVARVVGRPAGQVGTEYCFYVETEGSVAAAPAVAGAAGPLPTHDAAVLEYVLSETFEPEQFGAQSFLEGRFQTIIEYGPRLNFETAWSSNAVEICHRSGARSIRRLE